MKRFLLLGCLLLVCVGVQAQLFSDNFTRGADPGPLTPWLAGAGTWTVTAGAMQAGTNGVFSYGNAFILNNWTNYTVQARCRFQANAFGGGLGGRLDTNSGAHYAAWIYPENSPGGSNVLRLIKFQTFTSFGYLGGNYMASTNLAAVGTNFHTVRMDFQGNQIAVYFDGVQRISMTDAESGFYTNGGVSLDLWTDSSGYLMNIDDVVVNGLQLTANSDAYSAVTGLQLSVPAPGVLANDTGGNGALNASLVTGVAHGTLALNSNGGFNYTATSGYIGNDAFTYRANDGVTNSSATVALTVTADHPPVANPDSYTVQINSSLSVPAPGILANDTDVDGNSLTALIASGPINGFLSFSNNGGFAYTPNIGFIGSDSFTYRANDGLSNSAPAAVTISVLPPALFADDFTRGTEPGPIAPWLANAGAWSVSAGAMRGTNAPFNYGFSYITNIWTNYSVQARVQFPAGAFGGGLGGRFDPNTGAHYSAWLYPENSPGGPVLKLLKFQNYFNFTQVQQVSLASVGTNYHTVKLAFAGNQIAVYLDGTLLITATDPDYAGGGVSLDFWTDASPYVFSVDDVIVNKLATDNSYTVYANNTNNVSAPGVLGDDTGINGTNLTASLDLAPTNGSVTLNANGAFSYVPNPNYLGADTFTYSASDGTANLGTGIVNLTVVYLNTAPVLPAQTNRTIAELTTMTVTNAATDNDVPTNSLGYSLLNPPAGATISTNAGVITWSPTEAQGPGNYTFTTRVVDNGTPPLSVTNSFTVAVSEVNTAPNLPNQADRTVNELTLMTVNNAATDTDLPANALAYSFLSSPAGATISGSGIINWTPTEAQGPSTNQFTIRVVDNGSPQLSATNSFMVVVNDINSAPVLPAQTNHTMPAQTPLVVTNTATDTDTPINTLTYTLLSAPTNATISSNGIINWTPTVEQDRSTNLFRTAVTDDGTPPLSATNTFTVLVNSNPIVFLDSSLLVLEGCTPTNNAIDPGESVTMTFAFKNTGTGPATNFNVTLLETNGLVLTGGPQNFGVLANNGVAASRAFTFANTGSCGGTITANLQLKDGNALLGVTNLVFTLGTIAGTFTQNFDTVTAPNLPADWTTSALNGQTNWITVAGTNNTSPNSAFSPDVSSIGVNELVSVGIPIPTTPSQLTFRNYYDLEQFTATVGYDGGILEIQIGTNGFNDILAAGGSFASGGYTHTLSANFGNPLGGQPAWSGASPGFITTLVNLPAAALGQTVQFRWRCGTDSSNGRTGWRIDSIGILARICCNNTAPSLAALPDQTIAELSTLTVTNAATDASTPPSGLAYSLLNPPLGAAINSSGIITWTPVEDQGPSVSTLTTVVSDNSVPPLSATNSFMVTVTEVNSAPVLSAKPDRTIVESTAMVVTNTALDSDLPANSLAYVLQDAPSGASIDGAGVISWTPNHSQAQSTNLFTTIVMDDGTPPLSATNSFRVVVRNLNTPPVLPAQSDRTIAALAPLTVTNTASDVDIPPNSLSYLLINPPLTAAIDPTGIITWTPSNSQAGTTNIIETTVTDDGFPPLSATNFFTVVVRANEVSPTPPTIQSLQLENGQAVLVWTAENGRSYRLQFMETLAAPSWTDVTPDVVASGSSAAATNNLSGAQQRFYRVLALP